MKKIIMVLFLFAITSTGAFAATAITETPTATTGWTPTGWKPLHAQGEILNRQQFIEEIASYKKITNYEAELDWEATQEVLTKLFFNANTIKIRGWGDWKFAMTEARMVRNPQSGILMKVPRSYKETWTISSTLKKEMTEYLLTPQ